MKRLSFDTLTAGVGMVCLMVLAASTVRAQYYSNDPRYVGAPTSCGNFCFTPSNGSYVCYKQGCIDHEDTSSGTVTCCLPTGHTYNGRAERKYAVVKYTHTFCFFDCDKDGVHNYDSCRAVWDQKPMFGDTTC